MAENMEQPLDVAQPLPSTMRYSEVLEQSAPATIQERSFSPSNGSSFDPATSKTIRIPVAVSHGQFVDPRHSYMQFDVTSRLLQAPTPRSFWILAWKPA
jgi:hypothetical protein